MKTAPELAGSATSTASHHDMVEPASTASINNKAVARGSLMETKITRNVSLRHR